MRVVTIALILGVLVQGCCNPDVKMNLSYGPMSENTFDVYSPGEFCPGHGKSNRPAIIAIHGGAWRSGDKSWGERVADRFTPNGYVVFSINYRLAPGSRWPAQINDCVAALRYFRGTANLWGIDPDRIAAFGVSAGGHLAAMLALRGPDRVNVAVTADGEGDLAVFGRAPIMADETSILEDVLGPQPFTQADLVSLSPVRYVRPDVALMVIHSTGDQNVYYDQGVRLHDALLEAGATTAFETVNDDCHGRCWREPKPLRAIKRFLADNLN